MRASQARNMTNRTLGGRPGGRVVGFASRTPCRLTRREDARFPPARTGSDPASGGLYGLD
jgi:hypothetical protein